MPIQIVIPAVLALILFLLVDRFLVGRGMIARNLAWMMVREGAVLVDVRTPAEYGPDHAEGAVNIPVQEIAQRLPGLEAGREKGVVVYCASGHRSAIALRVLRKNGFSRSYTAGTLNRLGRKPV